MSERNYAFTGIKKIHFAKDFWIIIYTIYRNNSYIYE